MNLNSPPPLDVLIVDDEAPARRRLADLLSKDQDIARVLEAENGVTAISLIEREKPDVVFLDVRMPGIDGFGVVHAVGLDAMPLTIFVTAYDEFAVAAFEAEAVDYLLKPFGDSRFFQTISRVKSRLRAAHSLGSEANANSYGPQMLDLVEKRSVPGGVWNWLVIKEQGATQLVEVHDIDWIEAAGVYVTLHAGNREHLYRASLTMVASHLDPGIFVRIHRSSVVNIRSVARLVRRSHGEFTVILRDGTNLVLSRSYRSEVETMLGQTL